MMIFFIGNKGNFWVGYFVEYIECIEVICGFGLVFYGVDVYVGVVNIIMKFSCDLVGIEVGI